MHDALSKMVCRKPFWINDVPHAVSKKGHLIKPDPTNSRSPTNAPTHLRAYAPPPAASPSNTMQDRSPAAVMAALRMVRRVLWRLARSAGSSTLTITLSKSIVEKIERKIKDSKYTSVSSYVEDVVREVLLAEEMEVALFSHEEKGKIRKRLKELGYLE